jgi:hypothetical protein
MEPVANAEGSLSASRRGWDVYSDEAYHGLVARLSHQSVVKHFDAYADIPWDDPAYALDPEDSRFDLAPDSPLGATDWYRELPAPTRARIGLTVIATLAKRGLEFEWLLKQGLLTYASLLPDGSPEFRYCYHEVIEETQHALMFQEFVNRSGLTIPGLSKRLLHRVSKILDRYARQAPEMLFIFALGGEEPFDYFQRMILKSHHASHPLLQTICKLHIMEESRHLSFAHAHFRRIVRRLSAWRMLQLRVKTPFVLREMLWSMEISERMVNEHHIPSDVIGRLPHRSTVFTRRDRAGAVGKIRTLCIDTGAAVPPFDRLWKRFDLWERPD